MRVLGIDPGFGITGYGLIEKNAQANAPFSLVNCGVFRTSAKLNFSQRLEDLFNQLQNYLKENTVDSFIIEKFYFGKNINTGLRVAEARGVLVLCAALHKLPIHEISPKEVKKGVCGNGNAKKGEVQRMIQILLGLDDIPRPDDAADALAIAFSGANFL